MKLQEMHAISLTEKFGLFEDQWTPKMTPTRAKTIKGRVFLDNHESEDMFEDAENLLKFVSLNKRSFRGRDGSKCGHCCAAT